METKVTTKVFEDRIEQYVSRSDLLGQEFVWDRYKHEMDLRDQGVREGLIKLGWIPPELLVVGLSGDTMSLDQLKMIVSYIENHKLDRNKHNFIIIKDIVEPHQFYSINCTCCGTTVDVTI